MSITISSHFIDPESIRLTANKSGITQWLNLEWSSEGEDNEISLFIDNSTSTFRESLDLLLKQVVNAIVEYELDLERESNQ